MYLDIMRTQSFYPQENLMGNILRNYDSSFGVLIAWSSDGSRPFSPYPFVSRLPFSEQNTHTHTRLILCMSGHLMTAALFAWAWISPPPFRAVSICAHLSTSISAQCCIRLGKFQTCPYATQEFLQIPMASLAKR